VRFRWGNTTYRFSPFQLESDLDPQDDPAASAPPPGPTAKNVIGDDTRVRVTNASKAPYSQIGLIYCYNSRRGSADFSGTGWMINADTMITAAHLVFDPTEYYGTANGTPVRTRMWLGYNKNNPPPFGVRKGVKIIVHEKYIRNRRDLAHDIALIKLDPPVEPKHGWLMLGSPPSAQTKNKLEVPGYPGDLQTRPLKMYHAFGDVVSRDGSAIFHNVDSFKGQSGAPLLSIEGGKVRAIGVHTYGTDAAVAHGLKANMGVAIDGEIKSWLKPHL